MAPLTTSSVMVSLSLWVLWNCRPALYSWGLRGDKRPFNSERREVTEREALREGYQSDIHHTNLSLGTGPAKEGPWRWSGACVCGSVCACARLWGWGDTACTEWRLQGGRRRGEGRHRAAQVSGLSRCRVEGSGAERWGSLSGPRTFFRCIFLSAPPSRLHSSSSCAATNTNDQEEDVKGLFFKKRKKNAFNSSILRPESVGPHWRESGVQGLRAVSESLSVRYHN